MVYWCRQDTIARTIPFMPYSLLGDDAGPMSTESEVAVPSSHSSRADAPCLSAADSTYGVTASSSPVLTPTKAVIARLKRPRTPKQPKDTKVYKIAMGAIALRAQGMRGHEVSDYLGVPYETVRTYLKRAVAKGWLTIGSLDNPDDKVELVLVDKAIRNANELLDDRDKVMTLETLKGTGVFKQHQAMKVENTTNVGVALKVQIEMPPLPSNMPLPTVRDGSVGGAQGVNIPLDAEIIELKSEQE